MENLVIAGVPEQDSDNPHGLSPIYRIIGA